MSVCKSGEASDIHGLPILAGDLLRSFHFRAAQRRQKFYLYHVACEREDGYLEMVPARYLNPTSKEQGGRCWLMQHMVAIDEIEVVAGEDFIDRKLSRRKKCA